MTLEHYWLQLDESYTDDYDEAVLLLEDLANDDIPVSDVISLYEWGYDDWSVPAIVEFVENTEDMTAYMIDNLGYAGVSDDEEVRDWFIEYFYNNFPKPDFDEVYYEEQFKCYMTDSIDFEQWETCMHDYVTDGSRDVVEDVVEDEEEVVLSSNSATIVQDNL